MSTVKGKVTYQSRLIVTDTGTVVAAVTILNVAVGGLVGVNNSTIHSSRADIEGKGDRKLGALVGFNTGTISNSHATGNLQGVRTIGRLTGQNGTGAGIVIAGTICNSSASVSVFGGRILGGLVGQHARGTIDKSYAAGNIFTLVSTGDERNAGGLVGINNAVITNSYATGDVTGNISVGEVGW